MNKIVAISMVKNEADIIESFVRYTLTVADELLIVDHMSTDATRIILEKLQQEGLPLHIDSFTKAEHLQAEVMTSLMYKAIQEFAADIILPLDADEFILTKKGDIPVKEILRTLSIDKVYSLEWQNYFPKDYKPETGTFILNNICYRKKTIENLEKCFVGRKAVLKDHLQLSQGNHYAIINKKDCIIAEHFPLLYVAHFNWRSESQILSKTCGGWLTNVARYSKWTEVANHWQQEFCKYCNGEKDLITAKLTNYEPAGILKKQPVTMKYASLIKIDVLQNVLLAAEEIANSLAIRSAMESIGFVSVFLLLSADETMVHQSAESVVRQSFPRMELILVDFEGKYNVLAEKIREEYRKLLPVKIVSVGDGQDMCDVGRQSRGEYIQWLQSGDVLDPDKIRNMAVAIKYSATGVPAIYCNSAGNPTTGIMAADIPVDEYYRITDVDWLWGELREKAMYLSGQISGFLFSREYLEQIGWLKQCFIGEKMLLFSVYQAIFSSCRYIGCLADNMVHCLIGRSEMYLLYQIELRLTAEEQYRQGKMTEIEFNNLCKSQLMIQEAFSPLKDTVESELFEEYIKIIQ